MPDTIITRLKAVYMRNPAEALNMLPELFEAEERIVELPCKVGTQYWEIVHAPELHISDGIVTCRFTETEEIIHSMEHGKIGKTIFLTRAEAEQAMKEASHDQCGQSKN